LEIQFIWQMALGFLVKRSSSIYGPIIRTADGYSQFAKMRPSASLAAVFLLVATSCSPPSRATGSTFIATFNPAATLGKIGGSDGISYSNDSARTLVSEGSFSGVRIDKDWTFGFQGSHAQLLAQLDHLRAEVESQLSSSGCAIDGRGNWSGNFSGFSIEYHSGSTKALIRVTGVSFESGRQGLEILVYEH
jgi:hypothetical protein